MVTFLNGNFVPWNWATVNVANQTFNYGTACFEGIRGYLTESGTIAVFRPREHFERFIASQKALHIELPYSVEDYLEITARLVRDNKFNTDIYIRPIAYVTNDEIGVRLHNIKFGLAMFAVPFGSYHGKETLKLMVSSYRRIQNSMLPMHAKINGLYVQSALAKTEAHLNGYDEAVLLTPKGFVAECSSCNLFAVKNGKLITPPLETGILNGITRQTVFSLAYLLGCKVEGGLFNWHFIARADECFLTGTAVEITPAVSINGKAIGIGKVGPVTMEIKDLYKKVVTKQKIVDPLWHLDVEVRS